MAIYTVHVPAEADPLRRADRTAFVREGFSAWAFVLGPLFLLRHRAWLATLGWLVLVSAGAALSATLKLPGATGFGLLVLLGLFLGLEGNTLRRAALARRGFALAGIVVGRSRVEGERAYFGAQPPVSAVVLPAAQAPRGRQPSPGHEPVIGFFPEGP